MNKQEREKLALTIECNYCGSVPGNPCATKDGLKRHVHSRRIEDSKESGEPTEPVHLTLEESGTLCHVLMQKMLEAGGLNKQPLWVFTLYIKLAEANDKLMGKK